MGTQDGGNQNGTRTKRRRRWPWILLGVFLILVLLVALTPIYLSSDGFRRMIQAKISRSAGGTAGIGNLSIGWRKGVQVSDFSFREDSGWASVSIDAIDAQPRLASLFGGNFSLGRTVVDNPSIDIDLRKRPAPAPKTGDSAPSMPPVAALAMLNDIVVNDASIRVTDTSGKMVRIGQLNSTLSLRLPGQTSRIQAAMVVGEDEDAATVRVDGAITPARDARGWTLEGTSGDVVVEVNDLNLDSLAPILELAGLDLRAQGRVSADVTSAVVDGKLETLKGTVTGRDVNIGGAVLKGDRLQTSELTVNTQLTRQGQTIKIDRLDARTDWANVTASGTLPTSPQSLTDLLKSESDYSLQGQFDCNLPALLSQMPNTFGLKEGTQITDGKASGRINTSTEAGRATIVAQTEITGLAGTVDGKPLTLSEPVSANLRLSADETSVRVDTMEVSAAFGRITAGGDFNEVNYDGQIDLARLQSELGQFADLGPYQMTGDLTSKGQVTIQDDHIAATGTVSARQLVLTSPDGNSVSEPSADIAFAFDLDQARDVLAVSQLDAKGSFGSIAVKDGTVPLDKASSVPMDVDIIADRLDLQKITPYAVLFGSLPEDIRLKGIAGSTLAVTSEEGAYRIQTQDTQIQNFVLATDANEPFSQKQVTVAFDVAVNPEAKAVKVRTFQLESPQIKIQGDFTKARQAEQVVISGTLEGECDWQAVGQVASLALPEGLELSGRRAISLEFASTYPANDPNAMMANLDGSARAGFDTAQYKGLNIGATDVQIQVRNGLLSVEPFSTTVNNGQLNFAGQADFKQPDRLLRTSGPLMLAKGIELNQEMTGSLLQYVNPLFANVTGISGVANFECQTLAIPLAAGLERKAEVVGTISADNVLVEASGLLDKILSATGQNLRGQTLTLRPTKLNLQDGVVRYDDMQIDVGDNPINFRGAIGLDQRLDMTITLPWTLKGRTARVDEEGKAGPRIEVPLTGTIKNPNLDLKRVLQDQLFRGLEELFR